MNDWRDDAECRDMHPDNIDYYLFPTNGVVPRSTKAMCSYCPVRDTCYQYGAENDLAGVWGGEYWPPIGARDYRPRPGFGPTPAELAELAELADVAA